MQVDDGREEHADASRHREVERPAQRVPSRRSDVSEGLVDEFLVGDPEHGDGDEQCDGARQVEAAGEVLEELSSFAESETDRREHGRHDRRQTQPVRHLKRHEPFVIRI